MTQSSIVLTGDFKLAPAPWGSQCPLHLPVLWHTAAVPLQLVGAAAGVPEPLCTYAQRDRGRIALRLTLPISF